MIFGDRASCQLPSARWRHGFPGACLRRVFRCRIDSHSSCRHACGPPISCDRHACRLPCDPPISCDRLSCRLPCGLPKSCDRNACRLPCDPPISCDRPSHRPPCGPLTCGIRISPAIRTEASRRFTGCRRDSVCLATERGAAKSRQRQGFFSPEKETVEA